MTQKISVCFIIFTVLLSYKTSFADNYEGEVKKTFQNADKMMILSNLKELQKSYRQLATVYFQLGEVSFDVMQNTHPLFEYGLLSQYLDEMNIYYSNYLHFANKGEIRKYNEFYMAAKKSQEKKVTIEEVEDYVKQKSEQLKALRVKVDTLYYSFYDMVNQYNQCVMMFYGFCEKYKKIKDAQLLVTVDDIAMLDSLSRKYLYVLDRKDKFQEALTAYIIPNYNPKFRIIPIEMYRLDGLNGSDFTQNDITLWNYDAWIKDFKEQHSTTIDSLRKDIEKENLLYNQLQHQWEQQQKVQSTEPIVINKLLINRLNKVDYESLLIPFFEFRNIVINMIAQSRLKINSPNSDENNIFQQALFTADMKQRLTRLVNKKDEVKLRLSPVNIAKYDFLIRKYYTTGIDTFLTQETNKCNKLFYESVQHISTNVFSNDSAYRMSKTVLPTEYKQSFLPIDSLQLSLFRYDDISQNLLTVYHGNKDSLQSRDTLTLVMSDVDGREIWTSKVAFEGELVSLIPMDANYILITNKKVGNGWNVATIVLDHTGKYVTTTTIESEKSQIALRGIKLNSNIIAIVGFQTQDSIQYPSRADNRQGIFIQVNALGDKVN